MRQEGGRDGANSLTGKGRVQPKRVIQQETPTSRFYADRVGSPQAGMQAGEAGRGREEGGSRGVGAQEKF